jgi:outer membrane protein assembly factor BamD
MKKLSRLLHALRTPGPSVTQALCIALCLGALAGCAETATKKDDPAELFREAEQEISNDHYLLAIDKLREVKNKFPYSKFAVEAQLRLGDVYFLQESYAEAAAAYEAFRDLHPKHEKVSRALFRAGKSHFLETPEEVSRDLSSAEHALLAYQEFLKRFPADPAAGEATNDMTTLRERLAEKERRVADFYFKRGNTQAARARYEHVIARYPDTLAAKHARTKLEEKK